jgi:hypothetical protein
VRGFLALAALAASLAAQADDWRVVGKEHGIVYLIDLSSLQRSDAVVVAWSQYFFLNQPPLLRGQKPYPDAQLVQLRWDCNAQAAVELRKFMHYPGSRSDLPRFHAERPAARPLAVRSESPRAFVAAFRYVCDLEKKDLRAPEEGEFVDVRIADLAYEGGDELFRHAAGGTPNSRLKARLKAASDS